MVAPNLSWEFDESILHCKRICNATKLGFANSEISIYVALIVLISPFGWIAGQLSAIDRALPFALNMGLFAVGVGLVWLIGRSGPVAAAESSKPGYNSPIPDRYAGDIPCPPALAPCLEKTKSNARAAAQSFSMN
jgi:hypothetical protein